MSFLEFDDADGMGKVYLKKDDIKSVKMSKYYPSSVPDRVPRPQQPINVLYVQCGSHSFYLKGNQELFWKKFNYTPKKKNAAKRTKKA